MGGEATLCVRLFGRVREVVGKARVCLPARTVGELIRVLRDAHPELQDIPLLVAVNREVVSNPGCTLNPDDEVAVFPPVGGG